MLRAGGSAQAAQTSVCRTSATPTGFSAVIDVFWDKAVTKGLGANGGIEQKRRSQRESADGKRSDVAAAEPPLG